MDDTGSEALSFKEPDEVAPSTRTHTSEASAKNDADNLRVVLAAIATVRTDIVDCLGNLPAHTAEACIKSIMQLPKVPILTRARLTDVQITDAAVSALRAAPYSTS